MPKAVKQYDVLISHADEDTTWCEQLAADLRDAGLQVWFDRWMMDKAGTDLIEAMEKGLAQSRHAVLVFTPDYLNKQKIWAGAERSAIIHQHFSDRRGFAIPLLLKDCTLPRILRPLKYLDFRNPASYQTNLQQLVAMLRGVAPHDTKLHRRV